LQAKAPKAHALHLAAVTAAKAEAQQAKDAAKKLADAINPLLPALKENALITLPQREVAPAEFSAARAALESKVAALETEKGTLTTQLSEANAKLATLQGQVASTERVAKVMAKAAPILKDNAYKASLREELAAKATADATFDESKVEAEIDRLCVKFDKISGRTNKGKGEAAAKSAPKPALGQSGTDIEEEDLDGETNAADENRQTCDEGPATELVAAFGKNKKKKPENK
jgi:chromosome segregation ATPase